MKLQLKKDKCGIVYITTDAEWHQKIREQYVNIRGLSDVIYPSQEDLFISQQIQNIINNEN